MEAREEEREGEPSSRGSGNQATETIEDGECDRMGEAGVSFSGSSVALLSVRSSGRETSSWA